jgi:D-glycero-D-manno-heptose 1,7-bisphosphate phosphatase
MALPNKRTALFLDRDGVINEEIQYLHRVEDIRLIPGSAQTIAQMNSIGVLVIVVSNQAGIGRGLYSEEDYFKVQEHLGALLKSLKAHVDRSYFCPHHPEHGLGDYRTPCTCRKPNPGMLLQAADDFGLDLHKCIMVGDRETDLEAGRAVGCRTVLVRTGYGKRVEAMLREHQRSDLCDAVFESLFCAGEYLVRFLKEQL